MPTILLLLLSLLCGCIALSFTVGTSEIPIDSIVSVSVDGNFAIWRSTRFLVGGQRSDSGSSFSAVGVAKIPGDDNDPFVTCTPDRERAFLCVVEDSVSARLISVNVEASSLFIEEKMFIPSSPLPSSYRLVDADVAGSIDSQSLSGFAVLYRAYCNGSSCRIVVSSVSLGSPFTVTVVDTVYEGSKVSLKAVDTTTAVIGVSSVVHGHVEILHSDDGFTTSAGVEHVSLDTAALNIDLGDMFGYAVAAVKVLRADVLSDIVPEMCQGLRCDTNSVIYIAASAPNHHSDSYPHGFVTHCLAVRAEGSFVLKYFSSPKHSGAYNIGQYLSVTGELVTVVTGMGALNTGGSIFLSRLEGNGSVLEIDSIDVDARHRNFGHSGVSVECAGSRTMSTACGVHSDSAVHFFSAAPDTLDNGARVGSFVSLSLCREGWYDGDDGQCVICPAGSFCIGSRAPSACEAGAVSSEGYTRCSSCLETQYTPSHIECIDCAASHYQTEDRSDCLPCPFGYSCDGTTATVKDMPWSSVQGCVLFVRQNFWLVLIFSIVVCMVLLVFPILTATSRGSHIIARESLDTPSPTFVTALSTVPRAPSCTPRSTPHGGTPRSWTPRSSIGKHSSSPRTIVLRSPMPPLTPGRSNPTNSSSDETYGSLETLVQIVLGEDAISAEDLLVSPLPRKTITPALLLKKLTPSRSESVLSLFKPSSRPGSDGRLPASQSDTKL